MAKTSAMPWIGAVLITLIFFGTMGAAVLTAQRQQIVNPLVSIAESEADELNGGTSPDAVTAGHVNMRTSLVPFSIIYTLQGQPTAGSGSLDGRLPSIPVGVLRSARNKEYSTVTWQPEGSLRYATVTVAAKNYYVVTAQSLHTAQYSSTLTEQIVGLGCLASLLVIGATYISRRK